MHPVIEHIKSRKNKSVPINDGRKIALIMFGGTMTGVRGASALVALEKLGFRDVFDDIYTMSAGFANGGGFLSRQIKFATSIYNEELASKKFINLFRFSKIVDIDYLVKVIQLKRYIIPEYVIDHPTNLWVRLTNVLKNKIEYINPKGLKEKNFWSLVKVSMSIPYLNPGVTVIDGEHYKDPGVRDRHIIEHVKHCLDSKATDILIIFNRVEQYNLVRKILPNSDRIFSIIPNRTWKLGRLSINSTHTKEAERQMVNMVQELFK